jgi:hypothetical protein
LALTLILIERRVSARLIPIVLTTIHGDIHANGLIPFPKSAWDTLLVPLDLFAALLFCGFISYGCHWLEYTPILWPSHAVHRSGNTHDRASTSRGQFSFAFCPRASRKPFTRFIRRAETGKPLAQQDVRVSYSCQCTATGAKSY